MRSVLLGAIRAAGWQPAGGPVRIIASLTDRAVLDRILAARGGADLHGPVRGPPQAELALV